MPAETVPGADLPAVADLAPEVEVTTEGFPIVGIGTSAGGLEALQELFGNMPGDSGMGFVVVTHQHPGHTGMLSALLGKSTQMPVIEARDGLSKTS